MSRERISRVENFTFANLAMNRIPLVFLQDVDRPLTPAKRFKEYEIAKRDGSYIYEDSYDRIQIKVKIRIKGVKEERPSIYRRLIEPWLGVEAPLIFNDEKDKFYKAKILNSIDYNERDYFDEIGIVFLCEPFKYQIFGDGRDLITNSATMLTSEALMKTNKHSYVNITSPIARKIENQGNAPAKPIIKLTGTATLATVQIMEYAFSFSNVENKEIIIDCEKMIVYEIVGNKKVSRLSNFQGRFPVIAKGNNDVSIGGQGLQLNVEISYRNTYVI